MAYNTGNPIGSTDPRDLSDNSEDLDQAMNSTSSNWTDRLGNTRKTFRAAENAAQAVEDSAATHIAEIEQSAADVDAAATNAIATLIPADVQRVTDDANTAINTEIPAEVQRVVDDANVAINTEIPNSVSSVDSAAAAGISAINSDVSAVDSAASAGTGSINTDVSEVHAAATSAISTEIPGQVLNVENAAAAGINSISTKVDSVNSAANNAINVSIPAEIDRLESASTEALNNLLVAGGRIFPDEETGRATVLDGQYFFAESNDPNVSKTLWRKIGETIESEKVADDPSALFIQSLSTDIQQERQERLAVDEQTVLYRENDDPIRKSTIPDDYDLTFSDESGNVAAGLKKDGTWIVKKIEADVSVLSGLESAAISNDLSSDYDLTFSDEDGNVAAGFKKDGSFGVKRINSEEIKVSVLVAKASDEELNNDYDLTISDDNGNVAGGVDKDGTWVVKKSQADVSVVSDLESSGVPKDLSDDYDLTFSDESGNVAAGLKKDGTLVIKRIDSEEIRTKGISAEHSDVSDLKLLELSGDLAFNYDLTFSDENGNVVGGFKKDGTFVAEMDRSGIDLATTPGLYTHQLNFIINTGQSLGEGSNGVLTTEQEFDNVGFPARSVNPTEYLPLTVENTQVGTRGESPMYGALGNIKTLIKNEAGITYQDNNYQLLTANNCNGGTPISDLSKGGVSGSFEQGISQVQSGYDIAQQEGRSFSLQAFFWTQGERDIVDGTLRQEYQNLMDQLQRDYNTDSKLITGQYNDVKMISYQTCRLGAELEIAPAQLAASEFNKNIIIATPIYHLSFYDFQHIDAESSKILGGYYGLVYKRVIVDKEDWEPLKPVSSSVIGNSIILGFNKSGLYFDDSIGAQPDHGFSVVDDNGNEVAITSVELVDGRRVRINLNEQVASGFKIRYAWNSAINRADAFTGCCGNLRDSAGENLNYNGFPLHNWCVIFQYEV